MTPVFEAMSAMQKYIRRSQPKEALYFALKVSEFNPYMMWKRLEVIVSEDIGTANPNLPANFQVLRDWYFNGAEGLKNNKSGSLCLAHTILLMCNSPKSRDAVNLLFNVIWANEFEGMEYSIPDFAYDRHTLKGKMRGRGWDHFFEESAKLDPDIGNKEWADETARLVKTYGIKSTHIEERVKAAYQRLRVNSQKKQTTFDDVFFDQDAIKEAKEAGLDN